MHACMIFSDLYTVAIFGNVWYTGSIVICPLLSHLNP